MAVLLVTQPGQMNKSANKMFIIVYSLVGLIHVLNEIQMLNKTLDKAMIYE